MDVGLKLLAGLLQRIRHSMCVLRNPQFNPLPVVLFVLSFGMSSACAEQDGLTLEDFLAQVAAANPALEATEERSQAMQRRIKPAATLDDPFVAFGVDEIPFGEQRAQLYRYQISQSFPFPGKLRARESVARQRAITSGFDAETQRREFKVIATQQFYRFFYNKQAMLLNKDLQALVQVSMKSAKARYEAGGGEHHEWLLTKIELATLRVEQQKLLREESWLRATLNELRGFSPEERLESVIGHFTDDDPSSNSPSLEGQPELAALEAQASQAAAEYRLAKLARYPDFVVQAMAMQPRGAMGDERSNWGVMVGINLPLYAARKQANQVAAAQHEQHAVEMERLALRNRLRSEIVNARQALESARQMQSLYEDDVLPNTRAAVANAQSAYQARRMDLAKYLSVSRALKTQQLEFVALRIDVELARTRLRELLSSPPLMQFAPARPTVFDAAQMGGGMQASDAVSMGRGMTSAKATGRNAGSKPDSGSSGMGGMK